MDFRKIKVPSVAQFAARGIEIGCDVSLNVEQLNTRRFVLAALLEETAVSVTVD